LQANEATIPGLEADLALIRDAAREGGEIAMRHFRQNPETWMKNGVSPVSAADIAVDEFLFRDSQTRPSRRGQKPRTRPSECQRSHRRTRPRGTQ
jgi:myo-inositol-1(or 4)-monophosphatase